MVDIEDSGRVRSIVICLPSEPNCTRVLSSRAADNRNRISVGVVVKQAVEDRMNVQGVVLAQESYIHIGTPDNLIAVMRKSPLVVSAGACSSRLGRPCLGGQFYWQEKTQAESLYAHVRSTR